VAGLVQQGVIKIRGEHLELTRPRGVTRMPTMGSGDAFTRVVDARNELRKIAAELSAAERERDANPDATAKFLELERRYEHARRQFSLAIDVFSATRKNGNGH